jgi:hypothetical protein
MRMRAVLPGFHPSSLILHPFKGSAGGVRGRAGCATRPQSCNEKRSTRSDSNRRLRLCRPSPEPLGYACAGGRSGRRESNPRGEFGRLACWPLHHSRKRGLKGRCRSRTRIWNRSKRSAFCSVKLTARERKGSERRDLNPRPRRGGPVL